MNDVDLTKCTTPNQLFIIFEIVDRNNIVEFLTNLLECELGSSPHTTRGNLFRDLFVSHKFSILILDFDLFTQFDIFLSQSFVSILQFLMMSLILGFPKFLFSCLFVLLDDIVIVGLDLVLFSLLFTILFDKDYFPVVKVKVWIFLEIIVFGITDYLSKLEIELWLSGF